MPDYSNGKIYKIVCNTTGLIYIGSTCEPTLARRLSGHVSSYKQYINGKSIKTTSSFIVLENSNYSIILIETCICNNKDELYAKERSIIDSMECVNKLTPFRTDEEKKILKQLYALDNKEKIKEYKKQYAEINKESIQQKKQLYSIENKEQLKIYKCKYNEENKEKVKEQQRLKYLKSKEKKLNNII